MSCVTTLLIIISARVLSSTLSIINRYAISLNSSIGNEGTFIEKRIRVRPKYEGLFMVEINIKSSFGEIQKRFRIRVRSAGIFTKLFVREKERSLVDLIR